jgi:hypothetical protein
MASSKTLGIAAVLGVFLVSGVAAAHMNDLVARTEGPDKEVRAAQQSLADAIAHLQKVRSPQGKRNIKALDLVARAQKELRYEDGAGP